MIKISSALWMAIVGLCSLCSLVSAQEYEVVWTDEFDGTELDLGRVAAVLERVAEIVYPNFFDPRTVAYSRGPGVGNIDLSLVIVKKMGETFPRRGYDPGHIQGHGLGFVLAHLGQEE